MHLNWKSVILFATIFVFTSCRKSSNDLFISNESVVINSEISDQEIIRQNKWIYEQMNYLYFWCNDMPDSSNLNFNQSSQSFFNKLKSSKDRFSWIEPNLEYSGRISMFSNYGFEYQEYQTINGMCIYRVLLVLPYSPAKLAGIKRGDWFIFTQNLNKSKDQQIQLGKGEIRNEKFYIMESVNLYASQNSKFTTAVSLDTIFHLGTHRIGYLVYNEFEDYFGISENQFKIELKNIFSRFKQNNIDDFIIDLRYNPGGYVSICQYLCSLILADEYLGKISSYHQYNRKLSKEMSAKMGNEEEVLKFPSKVSVGGNNLGTGKIYALVSENTASASEYLINSLKPYIEVITIGTKTCGKGVGSQTIKDNNYKWLIHPIMFRYYNSLHQTVPDSGIIPDIKADEKNIVTYYELGDTDEYLLNIAISQIMGTRTKSASMNVFKNKIFNSTGNTSINSRHIKGLIQTMESKN